MTPEDTAQASAKTLAELSALVDGTLDPGRVDAVHALISRSPELSRRYERERQAIAALHALRAERAPARLRMSAAGRHHATRRPRTRLVYGGALAGAVAALVAALVLLLPGGAPGAPSVSQAAALALRGPAMAAPGLDSSYGGVKLHQDVQEVYFPNWSRWFGWRAAGQRVDRFAHRRAVTVYYRRAGTQIAYTILASPALGWPGTATRWLRGLKFQSFASGGRLVVTWRRAGHTCVLSGSGVSVAELAKLAAWDGSGFSA